MYALRSLFGWAKRKGLVFRRRCWPNTANLHVLISKESALRLGPVSHPWLNRILRGLPATLERLRVDRQLEEALASGADPLHLAEVFGIDETTALRYTDAARQLLQVDIELSNRGDHAPLDCRAARPPPPPRP